MFTIEKSFAFSAAHFLREHDGPCGKCHGHNYIVVLVLESNELVGPGFVREFADLNRFKRFLDDTFDHKTLNDVPPFDVVNPTTERLAEYLFDVAHRMFPELVAVKVSETPKTWVTYRQK